MTTNNDRGGKLIAVANMKGGVGKTTTVVSLAEALAASDKTKKILVIDLDPQASASVAIAGDDTLDQLIQSDRTFEDFIERKVLKKEKVKIIEMVHPTVCLTTHVGHQLDVALLPCGPGLRAVERDLIFDRVKANFALSSLDGQMVRLFRSDVLPLAKEFDYILFDCAPGISLITEIAIRLSDLVIVPTVPDRLSAYGLTSFYMTIWQYKSRTLPVPKSMPTILIARMDKRIRQHREVMEELCKSVAEKGAGFRLFHNQIPTSAALVEALMKPGSLTFHAKYTSQVIGEVLSPLVREVKEMLQ